MASTQQFSGSGSSAESENGIGRVRRASDEDEVDPAFDYTPPNHTPADDVAPLSSSSNTSISWAPSTSQGRTRGGSSSGSLATANDEIGGSSAPAYSAARPGRPVPLRTPSNAYAPVRRPNQFGISGSTSTSNKHRNSSTSRFRRNPNAEYRAQERAYIQRVRQDALPGQDFPGGELPTPNLGYSSGSDWDEEDEDEEESPSTADYAENDPYDQTLLYYGNDDMKPSVEELQIPANRERLEWHSMLASVLTGDVVQQEKKRLIGTGEQQSERMLKTEVWMGVRARTLGRTVQAQENLIEAGRAKLGTMVEEVIAFAVKGETEAGKSALDQVHDVVQTIEKIESLYPSQNALRDAFPRAASDAYNDSCDAVVAWYNTMQLINTELSVLRSWVGNDELDFSKSPNRNSAADVTLPEETSFIDRVLKEDGLKSLQGEDGLLETVNIVINKAKTTLIVNAEAFANRHLPPYIEELFTLMNFPSRLISEIIRIRLNFARNTKGPAGQGALIAEQMTTQLQILLKLAAQVKEAYSSTAHPQPGWDPPPCLEDNYDTVVLEALRYYFKMLNWKLSSNRNTFKEAEILEQEWEFSNALARPLEGGDVEVAEQFSSLTSKSVMRLTAHFERELQRRPEDIANADTEKRYKQILDSVRVRQRKLFRFSRILTQRFENSTEYNINMPHDQLDELFDALFYANHVLVETSSGDGDGIFILASEILVDRPKQIASLLGTCYHAEDDDIDLEASPSAYIVILRPETPLIWTGKRVVVPMRKPQLDIRARRLRLVASRALQPLAYANEAFLTSLALDIDLNVVVEQRANLPRVNQELQKIKRTAYKLSNTIMDSVAIIRKQTVGFEYQELIQTCFAFATEFGQRSVYYMDRNRRTLNNMKLTRLALDWVSFICDDCVASDRKTFRWAVVALEFAMVMTRGQNILSISDGEYTRLRAKVAGCMSLLISHFDIMGARSSMAAQAEKQRLDATLERSKLDISKLRNDEESASMVRQQWCERLDEIEELRRQKEGERQALGKVLEDFDEADRALTFLSSSSTNVTLRWQQGQFVGGGTFGSVYAAIDLDSGQLMAVKEIRLQDPQLIPSIVGQIRDEMGVLQVLDHPNIVSYYGIEPHRDKVYIFMEYCSGGSLAGLLEHGRIEDETVTMVYALQLLEGLAYLHGAGVAHRDIKPENILLDHNGIIKFVDFGAAKLIARQGKTLAADPSGGAGGGGEGPKGRQSSMTGTPMYMSPEVIKGSDGGRHGAVDIWSLGCVILEMVTGRRPWASLDNEWAIMYNIAQGNPPQLATREQLSELGIEFLIKCFERDPVKRASAAELLQCEWIMTLRNQLALEPQTPSSDASSTGSAHPSRQNSSTFA